ncbi:MAG: iron chelate uptake ABC transporter family permease subunit, partial [Nitrososphaeraceae archaeon]|nr:iron chelate uptake ABC transporter family permease subunit [Nitrososphaeraceae archaeon]
TFKQKRITQDSVLGIIFVVSIALRIILVQISPVAEVAEIESILKGDILFIGSQEFFTLIILLILVLTFFILFYKQIRFVTFDSETATALGFNSRFWLLLFYLIVGVGISITTRFVGDVFTFAYLLFPALIGILIAKKVNNVFFIAVTIGAIVPPLSIYLAFILDISSGPTAVISAFIIFAIVYLFKRGHA